MEKETLIERKKIKGTPFTVIKQNDKWFLAMGDSRLTEPTNTEEETIEKLETNKWLLLTHMIITVIDRMATETAILTKQDKI